MILLVKTCVEQNHAEAMEKSLRYHIKGPKIDRDGEELSQCDDYGLTTMSGYMMGFWEGQIAH